jgi:hypothetical protein
MGTGSSVFVARQHFLLARFVFIWSSPGKEASRSLRETCIAWSREKSESPHLGFYAC